MPLRGEGGARSVRFSKRRIQRRLESTVQKPSRDEAGSERAL